MSTETEDYFESASWTIATVTMIVVSLVILIIQRIILQVFDFIFEICIFYIPTVIITIIFVTQKTRRRKQ